MIWLILICLALIVIFQAFPLAIPLFIAFFVWMFYHEITEDSKRKAIVCACPFCGTPYATWNKPEKDKLRICYHCKRNCYGDGSTVGHNEADKLQLQQEAEDCQRVTAGTYDEACKSILDKWGTSAYHPRSLFTIEHDNINLWKGHTSLTKCPEVKVHPPLKTYAGENALARRLHHFLTQRLGDSAWMYHIDSDDRVVTVDDDFENAMKRKYQ